MTIDHMQLQTGVWTCISQVHGHEPAHPCQSAVMTPVPMLCCLVKSGTGLDGQMMQGALFELERYCHCAQ